MKTGAGGGGAKVAGDGGAGAGLGGGGFFSAVGAVCGFVGTLVGAL